MADLAVPGASLQYGGQRGQSQQKGGKVKVKLILKLAGWTPKSPASMQVNCCLSFVLRMPILQMRFRWFVGFHLPAQPNTCRMMTNRPATLQPKLTSHFVY